MAVIPASRDPYNQIKADIENELQQLTAMQAKLFAGHGEVAVELTSRLLATAEQLQALEGAVRNMVADPQKYDLSPTAAFGRQVEVETLRYTLDDMQTTCAQADTSSRAAAANRNASSIELPSIHASGNARSHVHQGPAGSKGSRPPSTTSARNSTGAKQPSSSMPRLPAGPPIRHSKLVQSHNQGVHAPSSSNRPPHLPQQHSRSMAGNGTLESQHSDDTQGWADGGVSYEAIMQQHVRQQDQALDDISIHVDRIKQTGRLMHEELEEQAGLLSGVEEDVDTTHLRLRSLRKKVSDVIKQAGKDRQLCLILVLSIVLVVLVVLAVA